MSKDTADVKRGLAQMPSPEEQPQHLWPGPSDISHQNQRQVPSEDTLVADSTAREPEPPGGGGARNMRAQTAHSHIKSPVGGSAVDTHISVARHQVLNGLRMTEDERGSLMEAMSSGVNVPRPISSDPTGKLASELSDTQALRELEISTWHALEEWVDSLYGGPNTYR